MKRHGWASSFGIALLLGSLSSATLSSEPKTRTMNIAPDKMNHQELTSVSSIPVSLELPIGGTGVDTTVRPTTKISAPVAEAMKNSRHDELIPVIVSLDYRFSTAEEFLRSQANLFATAVTNVSAYDFQVGLSATHIKRLAELPEAYWISMDWEIAGVGVEF